MMKINEVKKLLWEGIDKSIRDFGFKFDKKEKQFVREIPGGEQIFYIRIIQQRWGEIWVEPWWCIRIREIVDIYNQVNSKDQEYHAHSCVFESTLGKLQFYLNPEMGPGMKALQYKINADRDVEVLIKAIPIKFKEFILPYFDQNSSVERADVLLNEDPRNVSSHNWSYPHKAMMGLIAAKLTKNPAFGELAGIYDEELAAADPALKAEYEKLKVLLEKY